MPYDNLIQRGDVAAFTTDATRRGKTPPVKNRVIRKKPETPIPRPADRARGSKPPKR